AVGPLERVLDGIGHQLVHDGAQSRAYVNARLYVRVQRQSNLDAMACKIVKRGKVGAQRAQVFSQRYFRILVLQAQQVVVQRDQSENPAGDVREQSLGVRIARYLFIDL